MPNPDPLIDQIKEQYGLTQWQQESAEAPGLLIWRFFFSGWEIAGAAAASTRTRASGSQRTAHVTWQRDAAPHALFTVDLFECASRDAAVETVAEVLAQFERTEFERVGSMDVGELCFVGPGGNAIVFVRGNVVIRALRADYGPVALEEAARDLDGLLAGTRPMPEAAGAEIGEGAEELFVARVQVDGVTVELLEAPQILESVEPVWYRFRTTAGPLSVENRRPIVAVRRAGSQRVTAEAITPHGLRRQEIELPSTSM